MKVSILNPQTLISVPAGWSWPEAGLKHGATTLVDPANPPYSAANPPPAGITLLYADVDLDEYGDASISMTLIPDGAWVWPVAQYNLGNHTLPITLERGQGTWLVHGTPSRSVRLCSIALA